MAVSLTSCRSTDMFQTAEVRRSRISSEQERERVFDGLNGYEHAGCAQAEV
jgi:hypothetical protein